MSSNALLSFRVVGRATGKGAKKLARNKRELRGGLVNRKRTLSSRRRLRCRCMRGIFRPRVLKLFAPTARYFPSSRSNIFSPLLSGRLRSSRSPFLLFLLRLIFIRPSFGLSLTTRSTLLREGNYERIPEKFDRNRAIRGMSRVIEKCYMFSLFLICS